MKKIAIVFLLILSTVVTGFYANAGGNKTAATTVKVNKVDLTAKILIAGKADLATAD